MRIALFSPLPPKKTGIATYTRYLGAALNEIAEVHLFDTGVTDTAELSGMPVIDFAANAQALTRLDGYDGCIYHLGNNPGYHLEIYKALLRKPGIVVLHDTVLYYLIAGLNIGGLVKEFCLNYGIERLREVRELVESCPDGNWLRYPNPERYPFLKRVLNQATALIVHSDTAQRQVRNAGYRGPLHRINHLHFPVPDFDELDLSTLRANLRIADQEIVIGCFGFIGPTKRITSLITALDLLKDSFDFKLLIVGEGQDDELRREVKRKDMEHKVVSTGFVSDEDLNKYLALTDIIVNLRFPSMGETSGTLIRAFLQEKPCIVTNDAWFSELPDSCVLKIGFGEQEIVELADALGRLAHDKALRKRLGQGARAYVDKHCSPPKVARDYLEVVRDAALSQNATALSTKSGNRPRKFQEENGNGQWVEEYMIQHVRGLLPPKQRAVQPALKE